MAFLSPDFPLPGVNISYLIAGVVAIGLVTAKVRSWRSDLDAFPTVGSNGWVGSWWANFKFSENALDILREGYAKYKGRPFKIAYRYRWLVIISGRDHLEELQRAPEDLFSFHEAIRARVSGDCMIGKENMTNPYHVPIIRSQLSRNVGSLCPEIRDEVVNAFDEVLDLTREGDSSIFLEWKSVPALNIIQRVVFRTSNRIYVGLSLCRDLDWMDFNILNTINVSIGGKFLHHFPVFLEPFVSLFIPNVMQATERGVKILGPIIAERQECLDRYGDKWVDKPNDILSWLMDAAEAEERTARRLTRRMMFINFASIHSISQAFTHALIFLAENPQYMQPLREEARAAVQQDGWTKAGLGKMRKIDSLLKETQRIKSTVSESLMRQTMKDYTFSDGTLIPKGTLVSAPSGFIHLDEEHYKNACVFDPFRFSDMREESEGAKHQYVSTSLEFLSFGHGRHVCPGRFLAANVMKTMLAHIVLSYDMKLEDSATVPKDICFGTAASVDPSVRIMFRKRI